MSGFRPNNRSAARSIEAACVLGSDCASACRHYGATRLREGTSLGLFGNTRHMLSVVTASSVSNIMCIGK